MFMLNKISESESDMLNNFQILFISSRTNSHGVLKSCTYLMYGINIICRCTKLILKLGL